MADKRSVDDLTIEELERALAIKKRDARQQNLRRMKGQGRVIDTPPEPAKAAPPPPAAPSPEAPPSPISSSTGLPSKTVTLPEGSLTERKVMPQFEDALPAAPTKKKNEGNAIWKIFVDRSLLLVEMGAVIGLFVLGFTFVDGINTLQERTAEAAEAADAQLRASIPTAEPTPVLTLADIVLPGGHTPPTEAGGGQFNFDEIPSNLLASVRDQIFLPPELERPQATSETPVRVIIPDIGVDHAIVQGVDWGALQQGVGLVQNGATPTDSASNVVLAAHNDIYGEIFRHLDQLEPGSEFQIQTPTGFHSYVITGSDVVEPDDTHVMQNQGRPTATLISCYPYQVNDKRIVIFADRIDI